MFVQRRGMERNLSNNEKKLKNIGKGHFLSYTLGITPCNAVLSGGAEDLVARIATLVGNSGTLLEFSLTFDLQFPGDEWSASRPEESRVSRTHRKMVSNVAKFVAKNDTILALSPRFPHVPIESPL
ncbi:hypothetical protein TNCV_1933191 [Trichonephila clavipes]|nr:hypothetical protein TNCV_1933191 [Trichonephila clavipes]